MYTIIYKSKCPYSLQALNLLRSRNVLFSAINVDKDEDFKNMKTDLSKILGRKISTVPQIFDNQNRYIGGYKELQNHRV